MPSGTIESALILLTPGATPGNSDLTYYFATTVPAYAPGKVFAYSPTPTGTGNYTFAAGHFTGIGTPDNVAFASRLFIGMDRVSSLYFTPGSSEAADIVIFGTTQYLWDGGQPVFGFAVPPTGPAGIRQDIILTPTGVADYQVTISHEAMHTIGIRDINGLLPGGAAGEDNARYTIMSYNAHPEEGGRFAAEPQLYDVAAIQALWGTGTAGLGPNSFRDFAEPAGTPLAGQDKMFAIWDGSGIDTIDAHTVGAAALIDLRPGYFSSIGPQSTVNITAGATPSVGNDGRMNISIAFGAYIENAIGTSQGDLLIGNLLSNRLEGGNGADVIYGEGIDSVHDAGDGVLNYRRIVTTGTHIAAAPNSVKAFVDDKTKQEDHLLGGAGADYLHGGRGKDILEGGADDDLIFGGGGDDDIWGGDKDNALGTADGIDKVDYSTNATGLTINFSGNGADTSISVQTGANGLDTLHSIERIVASGQRDYLYFDGEIPATFTNGTLIIDMGAELGDVVANAHGLSDKITIFIGTDGVGTATSPATGGVVNLINAKTTIIGSIYDDEITDLAQHEGLKRIDGGWGDDIITVDGSDALIRGGDGDDEIYGGEGKDRLYGEFGTDIVHGGGGSDFLINHHFDDLPPNSVVVDNDELYGDEGHDYLMLAHGSADGVLIGGGGNDVLDARLGNGGTVRFGHGDGHDMILSDREIGVDFEEDLDGINYIDMTTVQKSDVSFVWNPTYLIEHILPSGNPQDTPGVLIRQGDLVIRIDSTGDTLLIRAVVGSTTYWDEPGQASDPPFDHIFDHVSLDFLSNIEFADGFIDLEDFLGSSPLVSLQFGSVAGYATALSDFEGEIAPLPEDNQGSGGDDNLGGSSGNDSIDGGDGDDSFQGSGGNDSIDGGAGTDLLALFGARLDYAITRDEDSGAITIVDKNGLEGQITITDVEKVYFAADNEEYEAGDLVGFWGTEGNDSLVEGNDGDNEINGLAGDDLLRGHGGADLMDGGEGADAMEGGDGDDVYLVDNAGDTVTEAADAGDDGVRTDLASYTLTANVERLTGLLATGQTLTGNGLDNVLTGGAGIDTLDGGAGIDVAAWTWSETGFSADLQAGTFTGDAAGDILVSIEGLGGGSGDDILSGTGGANILDGGGGADTLTGRDGDDVYYVDDEGDVVVEAAGEGQDEIRTTLNFFSFATANIEVLRLVGDYGQTAVGDARDNVIHGSRGSDQLEGDAGDDQIYGNDDNDDLEGGDGADTLDGGTGTDYMEGGAGDDIFHVDDAQDEVFELADEGDDTVIATGDSYALAEHVENLFYSGTDNFVGFGNDAANALGGGDGNDWLGGGDGDDVFHSSLGDDVVDGGDGADLLRLAGARAAFIASLDEDGAVILAEQGGLGRTIVLTGVESVYFADDDATYDIDDLLDEGGGGTEGDDLLEGDELDNQLFGLGGNDILLGHGGNDLLDGGTGADAMTGHAGNDTYLVDDSGDTVTEAAGEGYDTIVSAIAYTLGANFESLELAAGAGAINGTGNTLDNALYGNEAANTLTGLGGADYLDGGAGADTMTGGTGNDYYVVDNSGDVVTETSGLGTDEVLSLLASYTLTANVENLTGGLDTGQTLIGNSSANILTGGAGADVLNGGSGSDTATWVWSAAGVSVDLQTGATGGDAAGDTLVSIENLTGGYGDDTLSGTSAANILDGRAGADLLTGRGGNDIYYVDDAGDTVVEASGQGTDEVRTILATYALVANVETLRYLGGADFHGTGNDLSNNLYGGAGGDLLEGGAGYDQLFGGAGEDELVGGSEGDVLDGGAGADLLTGGTGDDVYRIDDAGDVVVEQAGEGVELVYSLVAAYTLTANVENLTGNLQTGQQLGGNALANVIYGLGGADILTGAGGNDELRDVSGNDQLDGGDGNDLIVGGAGRRPADRRGRRGCLPLRRLGQQFRHGGHHRRLRLWRGQDRSRPDRRRLLDAGPAAFHLHRIRRLLGDGRRAALRLQRHRHLYQGRLGRRRRRRFRPHPRRRGGAAGERLHPLGSAPGIPSPLPPGAGRGRAPGP
jgi:Ca2+-binding RTX toxin-like protein